MGKNAVNDEQYEIECRVHKINALLTALCDNSEVLKVEWREDLKELVSIGQRVDISLDDVKKAQKIAQELFDQSGLIIGGSNLRCGIEEDTEDVWKLINEPAQKALEYLRKMYPEGQTTPKKVESYSDALQN